MPSPREMENRCSINTFFMMLVGQDEIHKNMYKLEKQIIEMENFASHLEEVFITVEVRVWLLTLADTWLPSVTRQTTVSSRC